jgi:hypothetical protein
VGGAALYSLEAKRQPLDKAFPEVLAFIAFGWWAQTQEIERRLREGKILPSDAQESVSQGLNLRTSDNGKGLPGGHDGANHHGLVHREQLRQAQGYVANFSAGSDLGPEP